MFLILASFLALNWWSYCSFLLLHLAHPTSHIKLKVQIVLDRNRRVLIKEISPNKKKLCTNEPNRTFSWKIKLWTYYCSVNKRQQQAARQPKVYSSLMRALLLLQCTMFNSQGVYVWPVTILYLQYSLIRDAVLQHDNEEVIRYRILLLRSIVKKLCNSTQGILQCGVAEEHWIIATQVGLVWFGMHPPSSTSLLPNDWFI